MARSGRLVGSVMGVLSVALGTGSACGGTGADRARAPAASGERLDRGADEMSASGEVGGLDKGLVEAAFGRAMTAVEACLGEGRKRLPFLGGDVDASLEVDGGGRVRTAFLTVSTLGDHQVETCLLGAFKAQSWPRPVGGRVGRIDKTFGFEPGVDRPPASWTGAELAAAMAKEADGADGSLFAALRAKLEGCRREAGTARLGVTTYLDEDGMVQAVGMSMGDARGEAALACVLTTMQTTSFPSPGDSFVKLTLQVP